MYEDHSPLGSNAMLYTSILEECSSTFFSGEILKPVYQTAWHHITEDCHDD